MIRALVLIATLGFASAAHASPFHGLWRTPVDGGGLVRLEACGDAVCGTIVDSPRLRANPAQRDIRNSDPALRDRALMGLRIIRGRSTRPNELNDGWVYNPEDGNTYRGTIRLLPDGRLRVTGCAVWPLCRTQTWTRVQD